MCTAIVKDVMPRYIKFPVGDVLQAVVNGFQCDNFLQHTSIKS